MLSVLIPVYNYDVTKLVTLLIEQLEAEKIEYEIIVIDDNSLVKKELNREFLSKQVKAKYIELQDNVGRALIRNLLAKEAKYENLIFLDCDVLPKSDFIKNYLKEIDSDVVCGGREYLLQKPSEEFILHWTYGQRREIKALRKKNFFSSNFMIKKQVFEKVQFDNEINGYGHEDTVFAMSLEKKGYKIKFISNEVYHIGLNDNIKFLEKTKHWIRNSFFLMDKYGIDFVKKVKLLRFYRLIKLVKMTWFLSFLYEKLHLYFEKKLTGSSPNIFLFDIYKLLFIANEDTKRKA